MKTATIPPLRVDPELRKSVENLLNKGETLSSFVIDRRLQARASGEYYNSDSILNELKDMLDDAEK